LGKMIPIRSAPNAVPPKPTLSFEDRLGLIANPMKQWDEAKVRTELELIATDTLVKTTLSICPDCLTHTPAAVTIRGAAVWLTKRCQKHGLSSAIIENDSRFYRVSSKDRWGQLYSQQASLDIPSFNPDATAQSSGACCAPGQTCAPDSSVGAVPVEAFRDYADQSANKTCTVLVEITDACNLACRVCYSDSKGDKLLPFADFKKHLTTLIGSKTRLDSVQVTGGEASMHPEFLDIVQWLCEQPGVGKVYLPTNGLLFNKPDVINRLAPLSERILVLLQFDGKDDNANPVLRNAKPQKQREKLIRSLDKAGIAMQLTMTLSHGVSEADIAWVVRQGLAHKNVRLIAMQPAFFSGRYDLDPNASLRLTLSDCVKGIVAGMAGKATEADFMPIPCSHPNCGWVTLFARRFGLLKNIARHVDLNAVMNEVAYKTLLNKQEMQNIMGTKGSFLQRHLARLSRKLIRPQDVFGIAIKPFMDRFSYDQDRVSACCHHILDTNGNAVSFCEYNARLRAADSWDKFPQLVAS
jgi:7,8-dihydro-6-hydroxymethylpterin dimethyltransferase